MIVSAAPYHKAKSFTVSHLAYQIPSEEELCLGLFVKYTADAQLFGKP